MSTNNLRPDIQAALQDNAGPQFAVKKVIKSIPDHIQPDEQVQHIATGSLGDARGIIVITNKRALFLSRWAFKTQTKDFPRTSITSIEVGANPLMTALTIKTASDKETIKGLDKNKARQLQAALNN